MPIFSLTASARLFPGVESDKSFSQGSARLSNLTCSSPGPDGSSLLAVRRPTGSALPRQMHVTRSAPRHTRGLLGPNPQTMKGIQAMERLENTSGSRVRG